MNKKNITPNPTQPVDRVLTGQLPSELAELSEEALSGSQVQSAMMRYRPCLVCVKFRCSYDGDDAE